MRAAALSVWIFINLLCFGMCGYLYLIWSKYWMYLEKQRLFNPTVTLDGADLVLPESYNPTKLSRGVLNSTEGRKSRRAAIGTYWSSSKLDETAKSAPHPASHVEMRSRGGPRFPNVDHPVLQFDSDRYQCSDYTTDECAEKTEAFKRALLKEFHRVLMADSNVFKSGLEVHNTYNVQWSGGGGEVRERAGGELRCALRRVALRTVAAADEPFRSRGFRIPPVPPRRYNTCAVVTSAGALLGSQLGKFIDSHDMVLRFNNAPVENYTDDVGSKTTFRILNSQVVTKPEYRFPDDPLFHNVSMLIWDPANYSSTLEEWFEHPDFPLFPVYKRLLEDRKDADVHLLRPEVLWQLWAVLQDASPYRLRRNPPSSGFIGLWFALQQCVRVRMFEYVPSARATRRCHYHRAAADAACTLGAWHPLAMEKAVAERMRDNSDVEVFQTGYIDVPGVGAEPCA
ncbi:hypothetical protein JYU34_011058 [Plutella xylostella]|uniref:beta-galactoside alpha-(2,6)-sialyltransferase n=1 Tax=Plutella xylostella TaxID=51655 RepID=A0ABQ7QH91_PLUXY|nr:hypothetical protein JYU34_011058 [Plutella xylostella]